MERRDAIRKVAWIMGGTVSTPVLTSFLQGCQPPKESVPDWQPEVLSKAQGELVAEIAEMIIPATDTPGAKAANVHGFVDLMLKDCYREKPKKEFLTALDVFEKKVKDTKGKGFIECGKEERINLLEVEEKAAKEYEGDQIPFFRTMKELTLFGFFTSEIGATQVLEYVAVPGDYQGCVPYEGQKAWAT